MRVFERDRPDAPHFPFLDFARLRLGGGMEEFRVSERDRFRYAVASQGLARTQADLQHSCAPQKFNPALRSLLFRLVPFAYGPGSICGEAGQHI